jgi:hypothetical protein
MTNMTNVTADGKYLCTGLYEDLSGQFKVDLLHGYVGFYEYWEAMPLSQVQRIDTQSGAAEVVFEERYWIGHVTLCTDSSPTASWATHAYPHIEVCLFATLTPKGSVRAYVPEGTSCTIQRNIPDMFYPAQA